MVAVPGAPVSKSRSRFYAALTNLPREVSLPSAMIRMRALHRRFALTGIVLALLLRAAIPVGTMPSMSADGLTIALCTTGGLVIDGPAQSPVPAQGDPSGPEHPQTDSNCPFAHSSNAPFLPNPARAGHLVALRQVAIPTALGHSHGSSAALFSWPPPSRGPPENA